MDKGEIALKDRQRAEEIGNLLGTMNGTEAAADAIIARVQTMPDVELEMTLQASQVIYRAAWRVRGACADELQRRITTRLEGGRGQIDIDSQGVTAQMRKLASNVGIEYETLMTDAKIHRTFFTNGHAAPTESLLDRSIYVIASKAPDPVKALEIAQSKVGTAGFNRQQFQNDVKVLKGTPEPERERVSDGLKGTVWLSVPLDPSLQNVVATLAERQRCSQADAIIAMLRGTMIPVTDEVRASMYAQMEWHRKDGSGAPIADLGQYVERVVRRSEENIVKKGGMDPILTKKAEVK